MRKRKLMNIGTGVDYDSIIERLTNESAVSDMVRGGWGFPKSNGVLMPDVHVGLVGNGRGQVLASFDNNGAVDSAFYDVGTLATLGVVPVWKIELHETRKTTESALNIESHNTAVAVFAVAYGWGMESAVPFDLVKRDKEWALLDSSAATGGEIGSQLLYLAFMGKRESGRGAVLASVCDVATRLMSGADVHKARLSYHNGKPTPYGRLLLESGKPDKLLKDAGFDSLSALKAYDSRVAEVKALAESNKGKAESGK